MKTEGTLKRRISRTFLLQAGLISIAAVISVLLAAVVIKQVLVTEALRMEADYFWERYAADPSIALPDTHNLSGFMAPRGGTGAGLPPALRGLSDGFHEVSSGADFTTVLVTSRDEQQLYLVFNGERVDELAAYFGLVPLMIVLLVLYLSVWLAYRASHRAVSPISWLAREVNRLQPDAPHIERFDPSQLPSDADEEIRVLARALAGLGDRLEAFVERERTFTRDASHELRTPLTVIRVATDILCDRDDLPAEVRSAIERIRRSSDEMERLVEAFLLLARETEVGLPSEEVCINDLIAAECERLDMIARGKAIDIGVHAQCRLQVEGPQQALVSVIGNLLRNAVAYTDTGRVLIRVDADSVLIEDSGIGIEEHEVKEVFQPFFRGGSRHRGGHGVGLTIVRRFADRFGWTVGIDSQAGVGTRVTVRFPGARCDPLVTEANAGG